MARSYQHVTALNFGEELNDPPVGFRLTQRACGGLDGDDYVLTEIHPADVDPRYSQGIWVTSHPMIIQADERQPNEQREAFLLRLIDKVDKLDTAIAETFAALHDELSERLSEGTRFALGIEEQAEHVYLGAAAQYTAQFSDLRADLADIAEARAEGHFNRPPFVPVPVPDGF